MATHYDPSREDHEKFEERLKRAESPEIDSKSASSKKSATVEPVVTKSKFYNVSDSLKKFFGKKDDVSVNIITAIFITVRPLEKIACNSYTIFASVIFN